MEKLKNVIKPQSLHFQKQDVYNRNRWTWGKDGGVWRSSGEKQHCVNTRCAERGEKKERKARGRCCGTRRGVKDGYAQRTWACEYTHTHTLHAATAHIHTHIHTFRVLPHSWTHNLVPRWFMWVHVSVFLHIFHSQRVSVLTPFCILQWLRKFTSSGNKWDQIYSLTHIPYNSAYS